MRISYSAYDTFCRCPLQYKLTYIERLKTPEKPELYFGSLIHEIVQFTLKKDPILPKEEELFEYLKANWREEIFSSPDEANQYFDFGVDMLKKFYNDWRPGLRNIVATEKRFLIPLNDKHNLSGVIDRIDKLPFGAFEVIDYKTSKALPSQIDVDRDKQLATYNLAVESLWPEAKDVRLTLYYLKHNQKLTTTRRPDEVEQIKEEMISTAEKIEAEREFLPKLNPLCDWCSYRHLCPLWKDSATVDTEFDNVISEYFDINQKLSELEAKIHSHFDAEKIQSYPHKKGILTRTKKRRLSIRKK